MKCKNSPCIDICQFSGKNGWCRGCGRTRDKARKWKSIKPFAKTAILKDLARELLSLNVNSNVDIFSAIWREGIQNMNSFTRALNSNTG